jgi:hypothetical protein
MDTYWDVLWLRKYLYLNEVLSVRKQTFINACFYNANLYMGLTMSYISVFMGTKYCCVLALETMECLHEKLTGHCYSIQ